MSKNKNKQAIEFRAAKVIMGFVAQSGAKAAVSVALKHHLAFHEPKGFQKYTIPIGVMALSTAAGRVAKNEMHYTIDSLDEALRSLQNLPKLMDDARVKAQEVAAEMQGAEYNPDANPESEPAPGTDYPQG